MSADSASRGGMLAATILIVVLCSAVGIAGGWGSDGVAGLAGSGSGVSEFGDSRRSADAKGQVTAMIGKLTGANSCAASSCHGGGRVGEDLSFAASQIWQRRDVHARAWQVLTQPLASEMMRRLAESGSPPIPATEDARCLNCHVTTEVPYSAPRISEAVHHRDGVSCESCHGAASGWLAAHTTSAWRGFSVERKAELGFIDTTGNLLGRVKICTECHVGGAGKDVNHDLIAAGHPRMDFDFRVFHANEPKHWTPGGFEGRNRAVNVELRPAFEAEAWLAGKLATGRAALRLLKDRAGEGSPWPELAEYSCFSCHHDLRADSWYRLSRSSAGRMPWGTWTFGGISAAIGAVGSGLNDGTNELQELRQAMQRPFPDRELVRAAADRLEAVIANAEQTFPLLPDEVGLERLALQLIDESAERVALQAVAGTDSRMLPAAATWDEAAQLYLGLHAVATARRNISGPLNAEESGMLERLRVGLQFEEKVDSPGSHGSAESVREWSSTVAKLREFWRVRANK